MNSQLVKNYWPRLNAFVFLLIIVQLVQCELSRAESFSYPERGFLSIRPAQTWEEGLLSGNGTVGANVMGIPLNEKIIFTHEKLFLPNGNPYKPLNNGDRLFEIRRLIDQGLYKQATELAFTLSGQDSLMFPDNFVPAFDMSIKMIGDSVVNKYQRGVNFQTGETFVRWTGKKGEYERRLFVSRANGLVIIRIKGPGSNQLNCELKLQPTIPSNKLSRQQINLSDYIYKTHVSDVLASANGRFLSFSNKFTKSYPGSIKGVEGVAEIKLYEGRASISDDSIIIRDANEVIVLLKIQPLNDLHQSNIEGIKRQLSAVDQDYNNLLEQHVKLHGELFNRMKLKLSKDAETQLPIEELLANLPKDRINLALIEKEFDACRYNIISSTGELPPTLQGVWGGTYAPWWAGVYTHNGNLPSAISSYLMGNMPELMLAYTSYIESLVPYFEINAKNMHGCRGIFLPAYTSNHGFMNVLGNHFPGGFWIAGAPWAAHFFYDYYLYTGDKDFLAKHAVPFMEKCALFLEDYLYMGPDGKYIFSPGQSPENTPRNSDTQGSFNSTMDVAVAKELLNNLISASNKLAINTSKVKTWTEMLLKMPDYMISSEGIVKEWITPKLEEQINHRHASQLYSLFYGIPKEIDDSQKLKDAFRKLIELKLDYRNKDSIIGNMAFGLVQLGQAATSLGEGKLAYKCLTPLSSKYWFNNLASSHNFNARFNMDISGGMPTVIIKMLVESEIGRLKLLHALPKEWDEGKIEGVLCRGQIEINSLAWSNNQITLFLTSEEAQIITIEMPKVVKNIKKLQGNNAVILSNIDRNQLQLTLPAHRKIGVSMNF